MSRKAPARMRKLATFSMRPRRKGFGHFRPASGEAGRIGTADTDGRIFRLSRFMANYFLSAPKVIPRRRFLRRRMVKNTTGIMNNVAPAPTAGQSRPPSPMIVGIKGGAVCAREEVRRRAKAYSFQAKIRQKIAVAAMPESICGSTTFVNAWKRV